MPISQLGALNTTALIVPDIYVQIVPPSIAYLNGVPTNILGIVGTATWGPVNSPTLVSSMADYARQFGPIKATSGDMGTAVAAAVLQGASNIRCVRAASAASAPATASVVVTDGQATAPGNAFTATAKYPGTLGNSITVTLTPGSKASSSRVTVALPGLTAEVFDNIEGVAGLRWTNAISAINNGTGALRGPSELIIAVAHASPSILTTGTTTTTKILVGGSDGGAAADSDYIGVDTTTRTGMYALRSTGCSVATIADLTTSSTWTTQNSFGLSEGIYMIASMAAGQSTDVAAQVTAKTTAGVDSYALKLMLGDWVLYNDTVNGQLRAVSPAPYVAGKLVATSPEQSPLNKPMSGIIGTQRSAANRPYSTAELQLLGQAGIDVVTLPCPGGNYFGVRLGCNTSSSTATRGDNYTRLTNYIAATINAGMGRFVGRLQTVQERLEAKATLEAFFGNMAQQGQIGNADGSVPFSVKLDSENNPPSRVALGYQQADIKVTYLSVVEKFLVNIEGGQTVTIERQSTEIAG